MSKHATALHRGLEHASTKIGEGVPRDHSCFACVTRSVPDMVEANRGNCRRWKVNEDLQSAFDLERVKMSSMPIEWHKECQKNAEASHQRLLDELERMQDRVNQSAADLMRRSQQIVRAERLGKKSFDIDKFKPE